SVGERSVVIPSLSCNAGHRESQPSLACNRNTGVAGGCVVDPDAADDDADDVEEVKVVLVLLPMPVLSLNLTVLSERITVQVAP
ncbi:hypothetical protein A2U01_0075784, partial [Trifolium medium]|nr:hypothetical protein [Trifolium medium]